MKSYPVDMLWINHIIIIIIIIIITSETPISKLVGASWRSVEADLHGTILSHTPSFTTC